MNIENTVLKNDICSGCGACSYVQPQKFGMKLDQYEMIKAHVIDDSIPTDEKVNKVCPFSDQTKNEDIISQKIYPKAKYSDEYLGRYESTYVGHCNEGEYREKGSSGGFGKWLLNELLIKDKVDYVIQVVSTSENNKLFSYKIHQQGDDIISGSKSAYYPITLDGVLDFIKDNKGRYAISAIPCFSKAIRNIADNDSIIDERVQFVVGIVCGHLKSAYFAKLLGWQVGVVPEQLQGIDFRGEIKGGVANDKGLTALSKDGTSTQPMPTRSLFGGNWGYNFFKYKACDYCDDVMGETSDVSVGDAWLPEFINDAKGHNVLVVRNKIIDNLIKDATNENRLSMENIEPEKVITSQDGGFRHRREGLIHRLSVDSNNGKWVPKKRFNKTQSTSTVRKNVYDTRVEIRDKSNVLFKQALDSKNLDHFVNGISPLIEKLEYQPIYYRVFIFCTRVLRKLNRMISR